MEGDFYDTNLDLIWPMLFTHHAHIINVLVCGRLAAEWTLGASSHSPKTVFINKQAYTVQTEAMTTGEHCPLRNT